MISASPNTTTLSALTNNGVGVFVLAASPNAGSSDLADVTAAEVNGDGKLDLICANRAFNSPPGSLIVLTNSGGGTVITPLPLFVVAALPFVGAGPLAVAAGDLNGDGVADLVSANAAASGGNSVSILFGDRPAHFAGIGSDLTGLDAGNVLNGTLADARLSDNVALRAGGNDFTGDQTITGGAVSIGTATPAAKLTVAGSGAFNSPNAAAVVLDNLTAGRRWEWHALDSGAMQLADFTAGETRLLIDLSGNVGLGATAPEAPLHVAEGSAGTVTANANSIATFERSSTAYLSVLTPTNNESGILFGNSINSADGGIFYNTGVATRGLTFRTGGNSTKMVIESDGNVGIGTTTPTNRLHVNGGITCTALTETSDRNAKENFAPVSPREVLAKVAALPITTWNFKDLPDGRHMGPMAQDFHAAFGLGRSDTTITSVDRDGVALAAIQGLNQKVEDRRQNSDDRIQKLEDELKQKQTEITGLKHRLERLEQLLNRQNAGTH